MFSNLLIGLLIGFGVGFWSYTKLKRSSGGNTKHAIVAAAIVAVIIVLAVTITLSYIYKH